MKTLHFPAAGWVLFVVLASCRSTASEPTTVATASQVPSQLVTPTGNSTSPVLPQLDHPTQFFSINPTPIVETPGCTEKMVLPIIIDIQPSPVRPGSEITVTGRGGYIQDSCGGINESARSFKLYLDNEPAGDLLCYVNHCETKINLAGSITLNEHCLSTQMSICEFRFQVSSE